MPRKKDVTNWEDLPVLLDADTVALIFSCTQQTVLNMVRDGRLKAKKITNRYMFDKDYIQHYGEDNVA